MESGTELNLCAVSFVFHTIFKLHSSNTSVNAPGPPLMPSGGGSLFKHLQKRISCGYEAYMYVVQSEILCRRRKGHSVCVLVVMRSISLGEDYILKVVSGAGFICKLLCALALSY